MQDYEIAALEMGKLAAALGLAIECEFVPFSRSRNAGEASPSLNWRCSVTRSGKPVIGLEAIDYMQGSGYCPAHKKGKAHWSGNSHYMARAVASECETGKISEVRRWRADEFTPGKPIAPPPLVDVLSSLCRDSDALEYARFEDWADDLGFDPDSRKGEAIYRQCLALALALRAATGDDNLQKLRSFANEM